MLPRQQQCSSDSQVTTISHQGVADFSPAAVPTPVGAPGAGSGLAGISAVFEESLQPETAADENKQAMTVYVKTYRFINQIVLATTSEFTDWFPILHHSQPAKRFRINVL